MKANELRIGNLIYDEGNQSEENIIEIQIGHFDFINFTECNPIPLTEEILLKCGFVKEPMAYSKNIDLFGGGKKLTFSGDYFYIVDSEKQNTIPTDIITLWNKDVMKEFYLHQLQNLYFALTGEELTVNL